MGNKNKKDNVTAKKKSSIDKIDVGAIKKNTQPKVLKVNKRMLLKQYEKSETKILTLLNKIDNYLNRELYFKPDSRVLLAVSGGVDSCTLLDVFANFSVRYPMMELAIAHFNHKLRGVSSDNDEKHVRNLAEKYNILYFSDSGNVKQYSKQKGFSIEQAARSLRYKFLERIAKNIDADYVVTAHTADDSAETFFINLFRGSGITGLSGIPNMRLLVKKISIIRPLLCVRKSELIEYAKLRKLKWNEDETNQLLNYTRNKIRHELIPQLESGYSPALVDIINRTQKLIQGADNVIIKHVNKAMLSLIQSKSSGRFGIKLALFQTFDDFIKGEILQRALSVNFEIRNISMQTIDRIIELEDKPVGSICEISKNFYALRDRQSLIFTRKETNNIINIPIKKEGEYSVGKIKLVLKKVIKKDVKFSNNLNIEYLDWDLVPSGLYIRTWEEGDVFQPLGMDGTMKISDFLTNSKINLFDKKNILLLASRTDILWVCGMRLSDKYKIRDETTNFLMAQLIIAK